MRINTRTGKIELTEREKKSSATYLQLVAAVEKHGNDEQSDQAHEVYEAVHELNRRLFTSEPVNAEGEPVHEDL